MAFKRSHAHKKEYTLQPWKACRIDLCWAEVQLFFDDYSCFTVGVLSKRTTIFVQVSVP